MNLLTKFFLAEKEEKYLIGGIVGEKLNHNCVLYLDEITEGIIYTQKINAFMDDHPIVKMSQRRLGSRNQKYAGRMMRLVYDHLLALNWKSYTDKDLKELSLDSFLMVTRFMPYLSFSNKKMLSVFLESGGLRNFHTLGGLDTQTKIIGKICGKVFYQSLMKDVIANYSELNKDFKLFFPQLIEYSNEIKKPQEETKFLLRMVQ